MLKILASALQAIPFAKWKTEELILYYFFVLTSLDYCKFWNIQGSRLGIFFPPCFAQIGVCVWGFVFVFLYFDEALYQTAGIGENLSLQLVDNKMFTSCYVTPKKTSVNKRYKNNLYL
ncbi:UNVERIFIED_CONTAM: hypothetical protein K2H54_023162 [Gekko kuhli]